MPRTWCLRLSIKLEFFTGDLEITALKLSEATSSVPGLALFDLLGTDDVIKTAEDGALY